MKTLDIEAVRAFVLTADLRSFTRTAEALDTTQSAISLKIKRLEALLGRRLIERTPRLVRLSAEGQAFLDPARNLIAAHETAVGSFSAEQHRLVLGISHHLVGSDLPLLLKRMNASDPAVVLEMRVASSFDVMAEFDRGTIDAAVVLQHDDGRRGGEVLREVSFGWMSAPDFALREGEPLRLATQSQPCNVRAMAIRALADAGQAWTEVFVGGGVATLGAAASAGLAVAVLARRVAPAGTVDHGPRLGLPDLPTREAMLYSNVSDRRSRAALKLLAATFRASA
ncbi:MAG: LysR substrate-binding domain-containing protein [Xanthobacteraceae bacterium]